MARLISYMIWHDINTMIRNYIRIHTSTSHILIFIHHHKSLLYTVTCLTSYDVTGAS